MLILAVLVASLACSSFTRFTQTPVAQKPSETPPVAETTVPTPMPTLVTQPVESIWSVKPSENKEMEFKYDPSLWKPDSDPASLFPKLYSIDNPGCLLYLSIGGRGYPDNWVKIEEQVTLNSHSILKQILKDENGGFQSVSYKFEDVRFIVEALNNWPDCILATEQVLSTY